MSYYQELLLSAVTHRRKRTHLGHDAREGAVADERREAPTAPRHQPLSHDVA